jgi:hypothetical protein
VRDTFTKGVKIMTKKELEERIKYLEEVVEFNMQDGNITFPSWDWDWDSAE